MINIYIGTDARGLYRRDRGHTWYLMETEYKGRHLIKKEHISWMECNRNGAVLEGLIYSLRQIRAPGAEIHIYTSNEYVCGYFSSLEEWRRRGFMNKKGKPIKYRNIWVSIAEVIHKKRLQIYFHRKMPDEKIGELKNIRDA